MTMCDGARFGTPLNRARVAKALRSSREEHRFLLAETYDVEIPPGQFLEIGIDLPGTDAGLFQLFHGGGVWPRLSLWRNRSGVRVGVLNVGASVIGDDGGNTSFTSGSEAADGVTGVPVD